MWCAIKENLAILSPYLIILCFFLETLFQNPQAPIVADRSRDRAPGLSLIAPAVMRPDCAVALDSGAGPDPQLNQSTIGRNESASNQHRSDRLAVAE